MVSPPAHGSVLCSDGEVEGSECTFNCDLGFRLQGVNSVRCQDTEVWDDSFPICEGLFSGFYLCLLLIRFWIAVLSFVKVLIQYTLALLILSCL